MFNFDAQLNFTPGGEAWYAPCSIYPPLRGPYPAFITTTRLAPSSFFASRGYLSTPCCLDLSTLSTLPLVKGRSARDASARVPRIDLRLRHQSDRYRERDA